MEALDEKIFAFSVFRDLKRSSRPNQARKSEVDRAAQRIDGKSRSVWPGSMVLYWPFVDDLLVAKNGLNV